MEWWAIISALGIPSIVISIVGIFLNHAIKKSDEKREKAEKERSEENKARIEAIEKREERMEQFFLAILSSQRATNALATATAKAVQRIPDAHCNGDMHKALEEAEHCQRKENEFLTKLGLEALSK